MSALELLYRYGIWISVPVFILGLVMLIWCIWSIVRMERESTLASLPLAERQTVVFKGPGRVLLCAEGPRFTTRFRHLSYELLSENGVPVSGRPVILRATSSGVTTVRLSVRVFDVLREGTYTLVVTGLGERRADDGKHSLVFKRPFLLRALPRVLGIVLAAGLTICSLVLFLMKALGVQSG